MGHRAQNVVVVFGFLGLSLIAASEGGDTPTAVAAYRGMAGSGSAAAFCPIYKRNSSGLESSLSVQNTGAAEANVTVDFYGSQQTPVLTVNTTIPSNSPVVFNSADLTQLGSGFTGSVVVSADRDIVATVTDFDGSTAASYGCFPSGDTTLFPPATFCGSFGFNTMLAVQNTGMSAASVMLNYSSGATASFTVPPNVSRIIDQSSVSGINCDNYAFQSVVVTGDQPLAVVVENHVDGSQSRGQYAAPTADGNTVVVPLAANNYRGFYTSVVVQNVGSSATTVKIEYENHAADAQNLPLNAGQFEIIPSPPYLPQGYLGYATLSDGQPLGSVGETAALGGTKDEVSYAAGVGDSNQSPTLHLPAIYKSAHPLSAGQAFNGIVQVMNLSSTATTITLSFYDTNGILYSPSVPSPTGVALPSGVDLPGGESMLIDLSAIDDSELPDGLYSAVVESDGADLAAATLITVDPSEIFLNGFESGDTSVWALTVP